VDGWLNAGGTDDAPIYFTASVDDSVGGDTGRDGSAGVPKAGWWRGVQLRNAGSATMRHCVVAFSGYAETAGIYAQGIGALNLRSTTIRNTYGDGLRIYGSTGETTIAGNTFTLNTTGVTVSGETQCITLRNNNIHGNSSHGVINRNAEVVDVRHNWWGAPSGPYHPSLNAGGEGNAVSDGVLFEPWQDQENTSEGEGEGEGGG